MTIGSGISTFYPIYNSTPVQPVRGADVVSRGSEGTEQIKKTSPSECQTCKNRKYVDGSDEANVSFKTPGHISPEASMSAVLAHEGEHVQNAVAEGSQPGKDLVSATVSLRMSICPECGTPYVAGGTTNTVMRTYQDSNPYEQARKGAEASVLAGMYIDATA